MAEVLGAVASGLSIAELALKTVHAGFKLAELWRGMREFPDVIQRRLKELEILAMHLQDLESEQASSPPSSALYMARVQCHTCLTDLQNVLEDIQRRIQQPKGIKRSAVVAGIMLKGDVLARVDGRLASSLETLSFAGQMHSMHVLKSQIEELRLLRQQVSDIILSRKPDPPKYTFDLMTWSDCDDNSSDSGSDWTVQLSTEATLVPSQHYTEHLASLGSKRLTGCLEIEAYYTTTGRLYSVNTSRDFTDTEVYGDHDEYSHASVEICIRAKSPSWLPQSRVEVHFAAPSSILFPGWKRLLQGPRTTYLADESLDEALMNHSCEGNVEQLTVLLESNNISLDEYAFGPFLVSLAANGLQWRTVNFLLDRGAQSSCEGEALCLALPEFPAIPIAVYDIGYGDPFWEQSGDGQDVLELQRLIKREHRNNIFPVSLLRNYRGSALGFNNFRQSVWSDDEYYGSEFIMERMRAAISLSLGARKTPENTCQMIRYALGEWKVDLDLGITDNFGNTLLSGLAQAAGFLEGSAYADEIHELIREVLRESTSKEAELHIPARGRFRGAYYETPLLGVIGDSLQTEGFSRNKRADTRLRLRKVNAAIRRWLQDLEASGVDLASYGREEQFFLAQDTSRREFELFVDTGPLIFRLIGLDFGARPEDWQLYWSEATDKLAGDFWALVEPDNVISIAQSKPMTIPGAWIGDEICDDYGNGN